MNLFFLFSSFLNFPLLFFIESRFVVDFHFIFSASGRWELSSTRAILQGSRQNTKGCTSNTKSCKSSVFPFYSPRFAKRKSAHMLMYAHILNSRCLPSSMMLLFVQTNLKGTRCLGSVVLVFETCL